MNTPWYESIFFEEALSNRSLSELEKSQVKQFRAEGILILRQVFDPEYLDRTISAIETFHGHLYHKKGGRRIQDLWQAEDEAGQLVRSIAGRAEIISTLEMLYGRKAFPFQTLNFKWGSEQKGHSDTIHFNSLPERFMSGVWVALEDADEENGSIFYYPGSHRLPIYNLQEISGRLAELSPSEATDEYVKHYEPFIERLMKVNNLKKTHLKINKGDVVIWAANLVHGGDAIRNQDATRWSQVSHYYYQDCIYYTPLLSNPLSGDYQINFVRDLRSGEEVPQSYNGAKVPMRPMEDNLYNLSSRVKEKLEKYDFISQNRLYRWLSKQKNKE